MQTEAPTRPTLLDQFVGRDGRLSTQAALTLDGMWRNAAPGFPVVPCVAVTTLNVIALTPTLTDEGGVDVGNHMAFAFVADATLSGAGTATIGTAGTYKLYINGGATQAGSGDVVTARAYVGIFSQALDGGAGGLVILNGWPATSAAVAAMLDLLLTTRGDIIRRGATGVERFAAATADRFLGGDGTDIGLRTAAQVLTSLGIETGTYTPDMSFATPGTSSFSYGGGRSGRYFKFSNAAVVFWYMDVTPTIGTGSGNIQISMPYTAYGFGGSGTISRAPSTLTWPATRTQLVSVMAASVAVATILGVGSAVGPTTLLASNMTGGSAHLLSGIHVIFTS